MCKIRCVYCGKYDKSILGNKCHKCLKELHDITNILNNKPRNVMHYEDNVIPLRIANK